MNFSSPQKKFKHKWLVSIIIACFCITCIYTFSKKEKSPNTLEIGDIISTYINATEEPYCVPWSVFSRNIELIPISTSLESPKFCDADFGYPYIFQYKAKLQYKAKPIMIDGMNAPLTWNINLYGVYAGVCMIQINSGNMSGYVINENIIEDIASDLGFVLKEDEIQYGEIHKSFKKGNIIMFFTMAEGSGGRDYDIVVTNSFDKNPKW